MIATEFQDSDIMQQKHAKTARWLNFLSPTSFVLVSFVLLVLYQSLFDIEPPPIQTGLTTATAHAGPLATVVRYTRVVTMDDDVIAVVSRTLVCENGSAFDFPESTRRYNEGSRTAHRTLVVPYRIPPGTNCQLTSSYSYKPTFSIPWHHVQVPPVHFVVQELKHD